MNYSTGNTDLDEVTSNNNNNNINWISTIHRIIWFKTFDFIPFYQRNYYIINIKTIRYKYY